MEDEPAGPTRIRHVRMLCVESKRAWRLGRGSSFAKARIRRLAFRRPHRASSVQEQYKSYNAGRLEKAQALLGERAFSGQAARVHRIRHRAFTVRLTARRTARTDGSDGLSSYHQRRSHLH